MQWNVSIIRMGISILQKMVPDLIFVALFNSNSEIGFEYSGFWDNPRNFFLIWRWMPVYIPQFFCKRLFISECISSKKIISFVPWISSSVNSPSLLFMKNRMQWKMLINLPSKDLIYTTNESSFQIHRNATHKSFLNEVHFPLKLAVN